MSSDHHHTSTWLLESQLEPYVDAFMLHLLDCRYASNTVDNYLAGLTHFAHWTTQCNIDVESIDEKLIQQFLDDHLPCCNCEQPVFHNAKDLRAALGHLLVLLRANTIIADPSIGLTPVDEELRRFDDHMNHVRGLAAKTRKHYLAIIRIYSQFDGLLKTILKKIARVFSKSAEHSKIRAVHLRDASAHWSALNAASESST
jgi:integrase/recombinase XerC